MSEATHTRPRLLIENWLPVAELGIESVRERAAVNDMPALSFLHVWWARRPLVASAGVILASLLPSWTPQVQELVEGWIKELDAEQRRSILEPRPLLSQGQRHQQPDQEWYHDWLLHLTGIDGSPQRDKRRIDEAKAAGVRLPGNGYEYPKAYKVDPGRTHITLAQALLKHTWGGDLPTVLDPTAGGGSIPFEAARYGLPTIANDLNPVAATVLTAGVQAPVRYGNELTPHLKKWGQTLVDRIQERLSPFFPLQNHEHVVAYIWANAVTCPRTGRLVPLMPNKWLRKDKGKEAAIQLILEHEGTPLDEPEYRVLHGHDVNKNDADQGTVSRGRGVSPYDQLTIDGDYIKAESQAGRMRQIPYAIANRDPNNKRSFRALTQTDRDAIQAAEQELARLRVQWEQAGILPNEDIPEGLKTAEPRRYGMNTWADMFTPRQLLVHGAFGDEYRKLMPEVHAALDTTNDQGQTDTGLADAVLMLLALMQGKAINYNCRLASWHAPRQVMRSVFERHDFAFKWDFAEFEGGRALPEWCLEQLLKSYPKIAALMDDFAVDLTSGQRLPRNVSVTQGNAASLTQVESGAVQLVCIDPPYYDNVMYAELADFFYVWEKRTLGLVKPKWFSDELTDKANEAVANPARFTAMGRRKKELANSDYEAKMTAIFAEAHRVLADNGVLSVMFTHKRAEAWDTLGTALIQGGFTIEASWPVNTEAEHSLHQADKNSAGSTIMLIARKRPDRSDNSTIFLDDIANDVRATARDATARFEALGITGIDLMLATYGPALSVVSSHWPVYSSVPDETGRDRLLRPEEALEIARAEVVQQRRRRLVGKATDIDDLTDFVLLAWDQFAARQFPYDAARLLALAVGGQDIDDLVRAKILTKKSGNVELNTPRQRLRRNRDDDPHTPGVHPDASAFTSVIDAIDTLLYIADVDGLGPAKAFLDRTKLSSDAKFLAAVQGLINAMPRVNTKDGWSVPEAHTLDQVCATYLPTITRPAIIDPTATEQQAELFPTEG